MPPLVLAVEPDHRQSTIVKRLVRERLQGELILAESKDGALAALGERVPDVVLLSALLSPRDESELTEYLRSLDASEHVQTLTIPLLATGPAPVQAPKRRAGLFGKFSKKSNAAPAAPAGCDPSVFGDELATYWERAREIRMERDRRLEPAEPSPDAQEPAHAAPMADFVLDDEPPPEPEPATLIMAAPIADVEEATELTPIADVDEASEPATITMAAPALWLDRTAIIPPRPELDAPAADEEPESFVIDLTAALADEGAFAQPAEPDLILDAERDSDTVTLDPTLVQPEADAEPEPITLAAPIVPADPQPQAVRPPVAAPDPISSLAVDARWIASAIDAFRLEIQLQREERERHAALVTPAGVPAPAAKPASRTEEPVREAAPRRPALAALAAPKPAHRAGAGEGGPKPLAKAEPATPKPLAKAGRKARKEPKPVQDEWGVYDPNQCGFDALFAQLDALQHEDDEASTFEPDPSRVSGPPRAQSRDEVGNLLMQYAREESQPAVDVPAADPLRLTPLAMWARVDSPESPAAAASRADELPGLIEGLRVPASVASVRYASGCRIRRVRVASAPAAAADDEGTREPVVILAKKSLRRGGSRDRAAGV